MNEHLRIDIEKLLHSPSEGKILDLSQEVLSISDYAWLGKIIETSSVVETIILPTIPKEIAKDVIRILNKATIKNSTLMNMHIRVGNDTEMFSEVICKQIQSRLQRNKKKQFAVHGGGNIGLGLMSYIVSRSQFDYKITATSNNLLICSLINSVNKLWLQHDPANPNDTTCITNVTMVSRDSDNIIRLYQEATLAALCVTPTVLPNIAKDIAQALIARYKMDGSGLKILVLMNLPDCAAFVRDKIYNEILLITVNESMAKEIISVVEFVPTVIDRIVTPIAEEKIKFQLRQQLKKISHKQLFLQVGEENIDHILASPEKLSKAVAAFNLQFNLFNAEKNFSMYVPNSFIEAKRFLLINMVKDLSVIEAIKNKYINGPHAILAWAGSLLGFETIAESIKHPALFQFVKEMMEQEIGPILRAEYPELSDLDLEIFEESFFERCRASTDDSNSRVGRDPMRKLNSGERVRGPLELAEKHNLNISTRRLEQGLAAGFLYAVKFDPANPGCKKIREIYENNDHSFRSVLCYSGQAPSGEFTGFAPRKDEKLIDNVLSHIKYFHHLYENKIVAKAQSSVLSRQSVSTPKSTSGSSQVIKREKNVESSQMVVSTSDSNRPINHNNKYKHYIWHRSQKITELPSEPKKYLQITNS